MQESVDRTKTGLLTVLLLAGGGPLFADSEPLALTVRTAPVYPAAALENCIEGQVRLSFSIGAGGEVSDIAIIESAPSAVFDEAATKALAKMPFSPADDGPVAETTIRFEIGDIGDCRERLAAGKNFDCAALGRAHAALLGRCFSARREFTATINEKLAVRELAQLEYTAGNLSVDVIEKDHPNKGVEIGGEGDMVTESVFSCDRLRRRADGRYELESADEPERIVFEHDAENGVLLPLRWEFEEKTRFLFKQFHIQAHADYGEVVHRPCETVSDTAGS